MAFQLGHNRSLSQSTHLSAAGSTSARGLGYAACALAGCFWGMGFFLGKIAFTQMGVGHFVLYRFAFACAGLLPAVKAPRFSGREWGLLLTGSFLGVPLQFLTQFYGLEITTASHAALMVGTMPVILAAGATLFTHERLDGKGWVALLGSTAGVALIVLGGGHGARSGNMSGDLLVIVSMFFALGWILISQRLMSYGHSPLSVTTWSIVAGAVMLAAWVAWHDGPPPVHGIRLRVWLATGAAGLLSTAYSTLLWNWGIHHAPASRAGVFLNIEPALGSILGVELLGERLGAIAWAGGALIIAAAVVLTTTGGVKAETIIE